MRSILNNDSLLAKLHDHVRLRNLLNGVAVRLGGQEENQEQKQEDNQRKLDNKGAVLVTEFNELPDGRFLDPEGRRIFTINHFNLEVSSIVPQSPLPNASSWQEGLRVAIHDAAAHYVQESYPSGLFQVIHNCISDTIMDEYALTIVGDRFQAQNMRNGQWLSKWRFIPAENCVRGSVCVLVHYFEEGNVQLDTQRTCDFVFETSDTMRRQQPANIAQNLLAAIRAKEDDVQLALNDAYTKLADTIFKKLRRQLPVTRAKVDWAKMAGYKIGDQLPAAK